MSTPVYLLVIGKNNVAANLAWNARPAAETKALEEQQSASMKEVGGKAIISCQSAWADEEHPWWGVERFPSLEARIEHAQTLRKIGWFDIMDAFTLLGTADQEPGAVTIAKPIYALWVIESSAAGAQAMDGMPKGLSEVMWAKHDAVHLENNSLNMLFCLSGWANERYPAFGVGVYPNIEAKMRIQECLDGLGWHRYLKVFSIMGLPI